MHGYLLGTFWPPHRGHSALVQAAQAQVDRLTVLLRHRPHEQPPGALRAAWLREQHPEVEVVLLEDAADAPDTPAWTALRSLAGVPPPDVVFAEAGTGDDAAAAWGARHRVLVSVGPTVPLSEAAIRADPLAAWAYLEPPVRAHYALRICLVGAESTGKTTLATALAAHYQTEWVPESGRAYTYEKLAREGPAAPWRSEEFTEIAALQIVHEERAARRCHRVLLCDTDAFATGLWHRRYLSYASPTVEALAAAHRRPDLYLVTDVGTPFEADEIRDGEHLRAWMHAAFLEALAAEGRAYCVVRGTHAERMAQATAAIDALGMPAEPLVGE